MSVRGAAERPETLRHSRLNSVSSQFSDGPAASPSARSSTSSWCEEPVPSNMDISTGHMILVSPAPLPPAALEEETPPEPIRNPSLGNVAAGNRFVVFVLDASQISVLLMCVLGKDDKRCIM